MDRSKRTAVVVSVWAAKAAPGDHDGVINRGRPGDCGGVLDERRSAIPRIVEGVEVLRSVPRTAPHGFSAPPPVQRGHRLDRGVAQCVSFRLAPIVVRPEQREDGAGHPPAEGRLKCTRAFEEVHPSPPFRAGRADGLQLEQEFLGAIEKGNGADEAPHRLIPVGGNEVDRHGSLLHP